MRKVKKRVVLISVFTCFFTVVLLHGCVGKQTYEEAIQEVFDDFASVVRKTVADPKRATQVIELINKNHDSFRIMFIISQEYHEKFRQLNADYEATPEQFKQLYWDYDEVWIITRNHIYENLFAMKNHTTEDEWKDLMKQFKKYLNQRIENEYAK